MLRSLYCGHRDGKVSAVAALSMQGTPFAKIAVDAVKNGPDWLPGGVEDVAKKTIEVQPIALQVK